MKKLVEKGLNSNFFWLNLGIFGILGGGYFAETN